MRRKLKEPEGLGVECPTPRCAGRLAQGFCWTCGRQAASPPKSLEAPTNPALARRAMQILGMVVTKAVSVERGRAMLYEEFPEEMSANREEG